MQRPAWQRWAIRLASTRAGGWWYVHVAPRIDRVLLKLTGGRISTTMILPIVFVDTIGAKTGQLRRTPLVAARDGDGLVIIASRGGDTRHPGWYYNLRANPEVHARFDGAVRRYRARIADGEERERLWRIAADQYAGYDEYAKRAGRQIPVIRLERI
jgi:deazaflavin-dependent oxidoreductase (nitroreductase family)